MVLFTKCSISVRREILFSLSSIDFRLGSLAVELQNALLEMKAVNFMRENFAESHVN